MTTGQQAIERIAEVSGLSIHSVTRAARALREAGGDLWPTSRRGPQKNPVPPRAHHLSNIITALVSPAQDSREQSVQEYRSMKLVGGTLNPQWLLGKVTFQDLSAFERCSTFGEALDFLISNLADFACDTANSEHLYGPIKVFLSNRRMASISREWRGRDMAAPSYPEMAWLSPAVGLDDPNDIAIEIMGTIRFPMLKVLADLLPSQHNKQEQSPSPPAHPRLPPRTPETKTPPYHRRRLADRASVLQQPMVLPDRLQLYPF